MPRDKNQEIFGIFLAVLGTLFLLVNNHLLWFGWDALWPTIPFLVGVFLLRVFAARRKPRQLFVGAFLVQFGLFFFLFSSGAVPWEAMDKLWPTVPLIFGISFLSICGVVEPAASPLVFGLLFVIFAIVSYLAASGAIESRMSQPVVRIWPLFLIAAGVLVFLRARRERLSGSPPETDGPGGAAPGECGRPSRDP